MLSTDPVQLGPFLAAVVALVASPGPATLALASAGAAYGWRGAQRFLAGLLCGAAVTIGLVGSGVAATLMAVPGIAPLLMAIGIGYLVHLAYRIATAPPLGGTAASESRPGFLSGLLLALTNPKGYAVFATLFAGFVLVPTDPVADTLAKGLLIMVPLTLIDSVWLMAGGALRHRLRDARLARRINIGFAVLLLLSLAVALVI
jgi:threonine/homoserine/homoserine lactone efflux protein